MYVTGSFHDQLEVQFGIEQMIENDDMTYIEVLSELDQMLTNAAMIKFVVLCGLDMM
jgi:hypothetical protein